MDPDDAIFDFDLDDDPGGEPDFRATVQRSGAVRLVYWHEWLGRTGPVYTLIAARGRAGIGIADLTVIRDDEGLAIEVIIEFLAGGTERHRNALKSWAAAAGYTRAWFDDEVVELTPSAGGLVQTRCSGCGGRFVDGRSEHFWHNVRLPVGHVPERMRDVRIRHAAMDPAAAQRNTRGGSPERVEAPRGPRHATVEPRLATPTD